MQRSYGQRSRISELDMAKGVAIALVVLGHVVAGKPPLGNEWYVELKYLVYQFHMPLFMFLSGAAFWLGYRPIESIGDYRHQVSRRAWRLLPAFVFFALLIWAGKGLAQHVVHVDNAHHGGLRSLLDILLYPGISSARSLWYIYVLFEYYLVFPILLALTGGRLVPVIALGALLHASTHVFAIPYLFAANQFLEYTIYFALGIGFGRHYRPLAAWACDHVVLTTTMFLLAFLTVPLLGDHLSKTVIGLCSLPAVFGATALLRSERDRNVLLLLAEYTFTIYLMNTLIIGATKGALLKALPWDHGNFLLFFPVLLAVGLVGPILVHRYVLSRVPFAARMTK